jgi:hypothetical protein
VVLALTARRRRIRAERNRLQGVRVEEECAMATLGGRELNVEQGSHRPAQEQILLDPVLAGTGDLRLMGQHVPLCECGYSPG